MDVEFVKKFFVKRKMLDEKYTVLYLLEMLVDLNIHKKYST